VLDSPEAVFSLLVEIHLRRHKQLFAEDDLILVGQFKSSLVCMLVIGNGLVLILQQMAVLVLHLSHEFHCSPFIHLVRQPILIREAVSVFSVR
jgi:hypothetical protein